MGFIRKTAIVSTGGAARVGGLKANSKKARTAKASEKSAKYQKKAYKTSKHSGTSFDASDPSDVRALKWTMILFAVIIGIGLGVTYPIVGGIMGAVALYLLVARIATRKSRTAAKVTKAEQAQIAEFEVEVAAQVKAEEHRRWVQQEVHRRIGR